MWDVPKWRKAVLFRLFEVRDSFIVSLRRNSKVATILVIVQRNFCTHGNTLNFSFTCLKNNKAQRAAYLFYRVSVARPEIVTREPKVFFSPSHRNFYKRRFVCFYVFFYKLTDSRTETLTKALLLSIDGMQTLLAFILELICTRIPTTSQWLKSTF